MELYLKSKHLQDVTDLWKDLDGSDKKEVNVEEFKLALSQVDSQMKSLPATAQVYGCDMISGRPNIRKGPSICTLFWHSGCCATGNISF